MRALTTDTAIQLRRRADARVVRNWRHTHNPRRPITEIPLLRSQACNPQPPRRTSTT